jgi:hypothetical protein
VVVVVVRSGTTKVLVAGANISVVATTVVLSGKLIVVVFITGRAVDVVAMFLRQIFF